MPPPDGVTLGARHARIRRALEGLGLQALVVTNPVNIRYLTNHVGTAGVLVVAPDALHLLIDGRYDEAVRLRQSSPWACPDLQPRPVPASYEEALAGCLLDLSYPRVGVEAGHLTLGRYRWLEQALSARGAVRLEPTHDVVEDARVVKDAAEIETIRAAAGRLSGVAEAVWPAIQVGMRERQVAGLIEAALREAGYERPAFETIAASGPNAALPHHRAGDRVLRANDLLVLDFGGVLDGYCSDLTRTVSVGAPTEEGQRLHAAVLEAHDAAIAAVAPGVLASDVDAAARGVLERHGYGPLFVHGTGHGLGLDVHEAPRVGRLQSGTPSTRLRAGMVLTIEPGAYRPGVGGVRIEDDILVTDTGCDVLTSVPAGLLTLGGPWT